MKSGILLVTLLFIFCACSSFTKTNDQATRKVAQAVSGGDMGDRPELNANTARGNVTIVHFDFDGGIVEDLAAISGDAAKIIFEKMTSPSKSSVYENTCITSARVLENRYTIKGKLLTVQVEKKTGIVFSCEKWPSSCWGKPYYKCESSLDLSTGNATAR